MGESSVEKRQHPVPVLVVGRFVRIRHSVFFMGTAALSDVGRKLVSHVFPR